MIAELVQWRINQLAGMAVVDVCLAEQRRCWVRVLSKLESKR